MIIYRILLALTCGIGLTSMAALLLNVPVPFLPILATTILLPGAAPFALLLKAQTFGPPLPILAANSAVYSLVAYFVLHHRYSEAPLQRIRTVALRATPISVLLVVLASIPSLNPLWPRGIEDLATREIELERALPQGTELDEARFFFRSKGIAFREQTEGVVLKDGTATAVVPGDRLLLARLETHAREFPCTYDLEIVLLFGPDNKLKEQHTRRLRLCP